MTSNTQDTCSWCKAVATENDIFYCDDCNKGYCMKCMENCKGVQWCEMCDRCSCCVDRHLKDDCLICEVCEPTKKTK